MISRTFNYSFGDDTHIITEQTRESYPMCEHLKNVIDAFIKNKVFPFEDDLTGRSEYIIECKEHKRRLDLHTALHYYGKPLKLVNGKMFTVELDGKLTPIKDTRDIHTL
jgi:hypothetical protein